MQAVAFVDVQVSVVLSPKVIADGCAAMLTVGALGIGVVTITLADVDADPPSPEQLSVYTLVPTSVGCSSKVPPVGSNPLQAPLATQLVALVDDQVSVVPWPSATVEGLAFRVTVGAGGGGGGAAVTVKLADAELVPPSPVQLRVKTSVPAAVGLSLRVPLVDWAPVHAPLAVHVLACDDDHVSAALWPTIIAIGLTEIETVGATADTVTVADACALPPGPVQVKVYELEPVTVGVTDWLPDVGSVPVHAPEAVQAVASVEDQVSVLLLPSVMLPGVAARLTVGAGAVPVVTSKSLLRPLMVSVAVVSVETLAEATSWTVTTSPTCTRPGADV